MKSKKSYAIVLIIVLAIIALLLVVIKKDRNKYIDYIETGAPVTIDGNITMYEDVDNEMEMVSKYANSLGITGTLSKQEVSSQIELDERLSTSGCECYYYVYYQGKGYYFIVVDDMPKLLFEE